jgi:hypothetical protein
MFPIMCSASGFPAVMYVIHIKWARRKRARVHPASESARPVAAADRQKLL